MNALCDADQSIPIGVESASLYELNARSAVPKEAYCAVDRRTVITIPSLPRRTSGGALAFSILREGASGAETLTILVDKGKNTGVYTIGAIPDLLLGTDTDVIY